MQGDVRDNLQATKYWLVKIKLILIREKMENWST